MDAGSVVMEREMPIDPSEAAHMANIDLHRIGAAMMAEVVYRIDRGLPLEEWAPGVPPAKLCYYPDRSALDTFASRGLKLVDMAAYRALIQSFLPQPMVVL
jgi:methionyl-tRNA formyltransferase